MGHAAMTTRATQGDVERVRRCIHGASPRVDPPDLEVIPQVEPKTRVRSGLERAIGEHSLSPANPLFGWLKYERDRPWQLAPACNQNLSRGHQDRGMAVVSAGVMGARIYRLVRLTPIRLDQRQGIHIGTQHDGAARSSTLEHAYDAGLANARTHLVETKTVQPFGDDPSGPMLLVRQLRVAVKIAPQLDQAFALLGRQH
jgi:hypothetical protein